MASGLPVITCDVPGCRDLVDDGVNGILVPPRDSRSLLRAMMTLAGDPTLRQRMGRASRRMARERYDLSEVNARILREMGLGS